MVDNGSLRPEAGLMTRRVARLLSDDIDIPVVAASLAHSNRIPVEALEGKAIPLLEALLDRICLQPNLKEVIVIPLLLVTGGVIYQKIGAMVQDFSRRYTRPTIRMTEALVSESDPVEVGIVGMIYEQVRATIEEHLLVEPRVVLVDHGSPDPTGARTRNYVATRLTELLGRIVEKVVPSSMERRDGVEYDFNEPLFERALVESAQNGSGNIVLARLFLQPGKHNGKDGDVEQICLSVSSRYPSMRIYNLPAVFSEKRLVQLLKRRLSQIRKSTKLKLSSC